MPSECVKRRKRQKVMRTCSWYIQLLLLFRNFTNTNLKKYLQNRHVREYQDFLKLNKELGPKSMAVVQRTLEQSIAVTAPFAFHHPWAREIHRVIGEMVCVNCVPLYTVAKPEFLRLKHTIEPCSRTYLSQNLIPSKFDCVKHRVAKLIDLELNVIPPV